MCRGKQADTTVISGDSVQDGVIQTELAEWHDTGRRTIHSWLKRLNMIAPIAQVVTGDGGESVAPEDGGGFADYPLLSLHCLRIYPDASYRMTIDLLKEMPQITRVIDLETADHLSPPTLSKAFDRIEEYVTADHAKHFILALRNEFEDDLIVVLDEAPYFQALTVTDLTASDDIAFVTLPAIRQS